MAIEDAAVLGGLLSHVASVSQLPAFLKAYEDLRLPRTAETQAASRLNQHVFHLPDGPEQEERDAGMRKAAALEHQAIERARAAVAASTAEGDSGTDAEDEMAGNPNQWADKKKTNAQFGYDAEAEAERWWQEVGHQMIGDRFES